jgi:hypothetical protein
MEITTMQCVNSIKAATKGKAPIVAIPVEGHAPACVKRSRLAAWCKGVTIISAEVIQLPTITHYEPKPLYPRWCEHTRKTLPVEGPKERLEFVTPGARYLEIIGRDGAVKTRAKFALIDRRTAVKELAKWTERERAKHEKKILLGVLSKDEQRALKLAKAGDLGETMVPVDVAITGKPKVSTQGVPVKLDALPGYQFVVHLAVNGDGWSVTECLSGLLAGYGKTAEDAIAMARKRSANASPDALAAVRKSIEDACLASARAGVASLAPAVAA